MKENQASEGYKNFLEDLGEVAKELDSASSGLNQEFVQELTNELAQIKSCRALGRLKTWLLWRSDFLFSGNFWLDVQYWIGCPWDKELIKEFSQKNEKLNSLLLGLGFEPINLPRSESYITMEYFINMANLLEVSISSSELLKNWTKTLEELREIIDYQEEKFPVKFGQVGQLNNQIFEQVVTSPIAESDEDKSRLISEIQQAIKEYEEEGRREPKKIFLLGYTENTW